MLKIVTLRDAYRVIIIQSTVLHLLKRNTILYWLREKYVVAASSFQLDIYTKQRYMPKGGSVPLNDKVCQRAWPISPRSLTISALPDFSPYRPMSLLVSYWIVSFSSGLLQTQWVLFEKDFVRLYTTLIEIRNGVIANSRNSVFMTFCITAAALHMTFRQLPFSWSAFCHLQSSL